MLKRHLIILLLLALALASCAAFQRDLSPETRYLSALKWYNDNLEQYLDARDIADPETAEVWDARVKPLFVRGSRILGIWETALEDDPAVQEQLWLALKKDLLDALLRLGIVRRV